MMRISLVCVGKIKEGFYRDAVAEYVKRLSRFCEFDIVEVAEAPCDESVPAQVAICKNAEGERLLAKAHGYKILFDLKGRQISSQELSLELSRLKCEGGSKISFIIGGSYGVSPAVEAAADMKIAFGRITFPHQLMRVIAAEQIYRAFMIESGAQYHK